jgi:hypothetical protein
MGQATPLPESHVKTRLFGAAEDVPVVDDNFLESGDACRMEGLDFVVLCRPNLGLRLYRVYEKDGTFADVEAATAGDAIQKSGVLRPAKVEHLFTRLPDVVSASALEHAYKLTMELS